MSRALEIDAVDSRLAFTLHGYDKSNRLVLMDAANAAQ